MLFLEVADEHVPIKTKRVRAKKLPWISPQLKGKMQYRDRLKCKAIHLHLHLFSRQSRFDQL